ncbi:MAG: rRNA maturation RNase YbeY [Deltaproteobacteria bacterium]|nr:rRNA maturation RNase YbeY [Deltaproteobacteria bacterium]
MAILIENRQKIINVNLPRLRRDLNRILKFLECEDKEISLLFVDDDAMRKINNDFLGRDYPTNVIAFSLTEGAFGDINPHVLGDIVISVETALRDAQENEIHFDDELDFLVIHGLLHLLDYNHENTTAEEAEKMNCKGQDIFFQLNGFSIE